jgi:F-type H+-transporting ATPase subunit delta
MQGTKVASRYAKSLLDLALDKGRLEQVYADMKNVEQACKENRDLRLMLKSPIIKGDKKEHVLKAVFKDANEISLAFFSIIIRKNRAYALEEVAHSFIEQYKTHKKILTAVITTAFGLDEELRKKVLEVVKKSANSEVELVEKVDKNIIGGFIIQVGDKQDDTSIRSKIMKLNRVFSGNEFVSKH